MIRSAGHDRRALRVPGGSVGQHRPVVPGARGRHDASQVHGGGRSATRHQVPAQRSSGWLAPSPTRHAGLSPCHWPQEPPPIIHPSTRARVGGRAGVPATLLVDADRGVDVGGEQRRQLPRVGGAQPLRPARAPGCRRRPGTARPSGTRRAGRAARRSGARSPPSALPAESASTPLVGEARTPWTWRIGGLPTSGRSPVDAGPDRRQSYPARRPTRATTRSANAPVGARATAQRERCPSVRRRRPRPRTNGPSRRASRSPCSSCARARWSDGRGPANDHSEPSHSGGIRDPRSPALPPLVHGSIEQRSG